MLSNQFELFETYPDILGVSLEMFLESRWTPFLKKLVPKYQTVIDHLSALYAGLVKESSDLLEEGRKTLESVVYEEGQSLSVVRDQLLSVKVSGSCNNCDSNQGECSSKASLYS